MKTLPDKLPDDLIQRLGGRPSTATSNSEKSQFFGELSERVQFAGGDFSNGSSGFGGLQGGKITRINEDWRPGTIGPNRMIQMDGKLLRERAWDLYLNNPFASAVIDALIANVVGCGLFPDRSDEWAAAWRRWGGMVPGADNHCHLARDQTIAELQQSYLLEVFVGGGCLTHFLTVDRRSQEIPLAVELIGEEHFADHIDSYGQNPKTANRVVNGMEIQQSTGRTIAYHVKRYSPNDWSVDPEQTLRIPRSRARYGFRSWKSKGKRGKSQLAPVINWLWAIGYYTDNELIASGFRSTFAAMIKTSPDAPVDWPTLVDNSEASTSDINGNQVHLGQPGTVFRGWPGDEISGVGPNVPQGDSLPWLELMLRIIAVGANCSYEEAYRDYGKGSWSSIRAAMASDRKRFRPLQDFTIENFGNPIVQRFDDLAVGNYVDGFPAPAQWQAERVDVWDRMEWTRPGWESPNPKDDSAADKQNLENGTTNFKEIYGRKGQNWKREIRQRIAELEFLADRLELQGDERQRFILDNMKTGKPAPAPQPVPAGQPNNDDEAENDA